MGTTRFPAEHAKALSELRRKHDAGEIDDATYARHGRAILDEGNAMARAKLRRHLVALGLGVAAVILVVGWLVHSLHSPNDATSYNRAVSIKACRDEVRANLKSPSTAKFSDEDAEGSGTSWRVNGSVDSQNSFGATVRASYVCTATGSDATLVYLK